MRRNISYLRYLIAHKWFVYCAGDRLGVSLWRLLIHDWHKFLPSEWGPYARTFYNPDGSKAEYKSSDEFAEAWRLHQHRGTHHWQHWLLTWDNGKTVPLEIPKVCCEEMVADWCGAGRAITGKWEVSEWYEKNKDKINLHPNTRDYVCYLINFWEQRVSPHAKNPI